MAIYARGPVDTALTYYVRHEESMRRGFMETLKRLGYRPQFIITGQEVLPARSVAILFGTPRNGGREYLISSILHDTPDAWAAKAQWRIRFDMTMEAEQFARAFCEVDAELCVEARERIYSGGKW